MTQDLQKQIDELKETLGHLKGRIAVLECANCQAIDLLDPHSLELFKKDIASKSPSYFTENLIGFPIPFHNGTVDQLRRLKRKLDI